jgi:hypothetical protein
MPLNFPAIGSASRTASSWCSVAHVAHRHQGRRSRKESHRGVLQRRTVRQASMLAATPQGHSPTLVLPKSGACVYMSVYIDRSIGIKNIEKTRGCYD